MSELTKDDQRKVALARKIIDRHQVALSVLARGENSAYMTEEFKAGLAEAKERLAPYSKAARDRSVG